MSKFNIFIGYRRADVAGEAGRMYDRLAAHFTRARVFKDVESIEPGRDYKAHVLEFINSAEVFLALIGERWSENRKRLDEEGDLVRIELEVGLRNKIIQVIPVLIGKAQMPKAVDLPPSICALADLQAVDVRQDPHFHSDMNRLIKILSKRGETGSVDVVPKDNAATARAAAKWAEIENSMDRAAYRAFENEFSGMPEAKSASRAVQAISAWVALDKKDPRLVETFARRISGKVPDALTQIVNSQLQVLEAKSIRRDDYRRSEKNRDLRILGLGPKSGREDWTRQFEGWKRDLGPARFPPQGHPEVAQRLRNIRLAYNRLIQFG